MVINPMVRRLAVPIVLAVCVAAVYTGGRADGRRLAEAAADREKAELTAAHQAAALAAEQEYAAKLAEAAAEKQKWFDFARKQSAELAAALNRLDIQTAKIEKEIPNAVQKDNDRAAVPYNGIGPDSLRLYNRALGYGEDGGADEDAAGTGRFDGTAAAPESADGGQPCRPAATCGEVRPLCAGFGNTECRMA
ncbi:hypothetical protein [Neisseria leonii]|uniref:hypothetical protein n=1 Tax=Neisseria leonii TaxID=2995413 RepID=UPI00237A19B7|nr:hypothetical protein [Neisseria sp. 3986]MDD9325629.1 hypothetical protein [Neisseria sp. 3986]